MTRDIRKKMTTVFVYPLEVTVGVSVWYDYRVRVITDVVASNISPGNYVNIYFDNETGFILHSVKEELRVIV